MAQYVTQEQILGEISMPDLIMLTDDDGDGNLDQAILTQAIVNASSDVDAFLSNLYDTPFNPVPPTISNYALTIVCYNLYRRRLTPDEKNLFYEDYKELIDFLKQVNKGEAHISQVPERSFSQVASTQSKSIYGAALFSNTLSNTM